MTQHVLIVDDDSLECQLLQKTLHAAEIQAVTLTDSRQAIDVLRKQTFDAIFVDVNMPPPDGMEVTRQIRASESNTKTPVIMITGHEDHSVVARGFQAGINFLLYKPIVKDRLLNLVRVIHSVNRVEKRRFHRVFTRQKALITMSADKLGKETVEGHTVDMSLNGVLFQSGRTFPSGSRVMVRLELSSVKEPLAIYGVVARVAGPDSMGIYFNGIGLKESKQLQDFLLPLMIAPNNPAASPP